MKSLHDREPAQSVDRVQLLARGLFVVAGVNAFLAIASTGLRDGGGIVALFAGAVFAFGVVGRPVAFAAVLQVILALTFLVVLVGDVLVGVENFLFLAAFLNSMASIMRRVWGRQKNDPKTARPA